MLSTANNTLVQMDSKAASESDSAAVSQRGTRTATPLLTTLTITGFIVLITQLSAWRW